MPNKILVVEDDRTIAQLLQTTLQDYGYEVSLTFDGKTGMEEALSEKYDLIILDLKLPEKDGLEICRRVRSSPEYTPILILTSMSSEVDRVLGLEIGADDYLTKPFSIRELAARVKALFRRMEALKVPCPDEHEVIERGNFHIDVERRAVALGGKAVDLTAKEFDLLLQFARNPGRVYTRSELLDLVWGYAYKGYEHTVNSHINRLRSKIEKDPNHPRYILTVWGVGYKFFDPEEKRERDV